MNTSEEEWKKLLGVRNHIDDERFDGLYLYVKDFITALLAKAKQDTLKEVGETPHRCPVCIGTGTVGAGFYTNGVAGSSTVNIECRSCFGKGYILTAPLSKLDKL